MKGTLASFAIGDKVTLKSVSDKQLTIQLYSMGCFEGEEIIIEQIAPFGDPLIISVDDSFISLRRDDALKMRVERSN